MLGACGKAKQQSDVKNEDQSRWKTLEQKDFTIQYPDSFELKTSGEMGVTFMLLSRQLSSDDLFRENINLLIQDLKGRNISLDTYVKISENQIATMIVDSDLIESKRIRNGDSKYQKVIYTGKQGAFDLKYEQYYIVENEKAYVLTLTAERNHFDAYQGIGEEIMNSFKLK